MRDMEWGQTESKVKWKRSGPWIDVDKLMIDEKENGEKYAKAATESGIELTWI